jgi:hypothetical protein
MGGRLAIWFLILGSIAFLVFVFSQSDRSDDPIVSKVVKEIIEKVHPHPFR